jgi:hypothetical protein
MPNTDLSEIKAAIITLEKSNLATAEASKKNTESHTALNLQLVELIGEIKATNVKHDLIIEHSIEITNTTASSLKDHISYAEPILLRVKRGQDNIDKMISGIFSKGGLMAFTLVLLALATFLGINPSDIKIK